MRKLKKFIYWFTEYEDFKDLSTAKKLDELFWDIQTFAILLFLILLLVLIPSKVSADDVQTYTVIPEDNCFSFISGSGYDVILTDADTEVRSVLFYSPRRGTNNYIFYIVSLSPFKYKTCASIEYSNSTFYESVNYDGVSYYYGQILGGYNTDLTVNVYSEAMVSGNSYDPDAAYRLTFLGSSPSIDYSPVRKIYPPDNNSVLRDYSAYFDRINSTDSYSLGLYLTRYVKDLDLLASYYLAFLPDQNSTTTNSKGWNSFDYSFNNDNELVISFNDILTTSWGITAVYDHDAFSFYTPTDDLTSSFLNDKDYWNTYALIYPGLNNPSLIELYLNIWNPAVNQNFIYSDLDIPSSITFQTINTQYRVKKISTVEDPVYLKLYTSVVETDDYYDFYVLLSLADGASSPVSSIYNDGLYKDSESGIIEDLTCYNTMDYLGLNPHPVLWIDTSTTATNTIDSLIDGTYNEELISGDDPTLYPDKEQYNSFTFTGLYKSSFNLLSEYIRSDSDSINNAYYTLCDNWKYFDLAARDLRNESFLASFTFLSNQLDWAYNNTILQVPLNMSLVFSVILSIIF